MYKWFGTDFEYYMTSITNNGDRLLKSYNEYLGVNVWYVDPVVKGWSYPITVQVDPNMTRFIAHHKSLTGT